MSKTSSCIELLRILYSRNNVISAKELSSLLETKERNITEYIRELRYAGYDIETVSGRYGGYRLNKESLFPSIKLSDAEQEAFVAGYNYIILRNDFLEKTVFIKAISKITSAILNKNIKNDELLLVDKFPPRMSQDDLEARYQTISKCILNSKCLSINYMSLNNGKSERIVHPYKLFSYNNDWYVLCFDELVNDFRYFKLTRILSFVPLNKDFRKVSTYKQTDYLDEFGMKKNGEWYPIKLKLIDDYQVICNERIFGKEQVVENFEDYSVLSCLMQNKISIIHFVLSLGNKCTVLEPQWLKDDIFNICEEIKAMYSKN